MWELRSLGASRRCSLNGISAISQAPAAPSPVHASSSTALGRGGDCPAMWANRAIQSWFTIISRRMPASAEPSPASLPSNHIAGQTRFVRKYAVRPRSHLPCICQSLPARSADSSCTFGRRLRYQPARARTGPAGKVKHGGLRPRAVQSVRTMVAMVWTSPSVTLNTRPAASGWHTASRAARATSLS